MVLKFIGTKFSGAEPDWSMTHGKSYNIIKINKGTYTIVNDNNREDNYDESFFETIKNTRDLRINKILNEN